MKVIDLPPQLIAMYVQTRNDTVQEVCNELLAMAKNMPSREASTALRTAAYVLDRKKVVREDTIEEDETLNEQGKRKIRSVLNTANQGRERIVPFLKWKKELGFEQEESPTEEEVRVRYKDLAMENHPDRGGDPDKFARISNAKEEALEYLEGKPKEVPEGRCRRCLGRRWIQVDCPQCKG